MSRLICAVCALLTVSATAYPQTPNDSVLVTPHAGVGVTTRAQSARNAVVFQVTNTGGTAANFVLDCSVTGKVESCSVIGNDTLTLEPGQHRAVPVRYAASDEGAGRVSLSAARGGAAGPTDSGGFDVSVTAEPCEEECGGGGGGTTGVTVLISPSIATVGSPQLDVYVDWCSFGSALNASSRSITLNGVNVTSQLSYITPSFNDCGGSGGWAYSMGTITLQVGANTLVASIANTAGQSDADTARYTLVANPVTVRITPATSSSFTSREVDVTIDWCSVGSNLNAASRNITLNGASVTSQFTYNNTIGISSDCPDGVSATSTGSIDLPSGATTIAASISNLAGQSESNAVTYTIPAVDIATVNPGASVRRDLCRTIAAGPATAYECGDLRMVHTLPGVRTRNRERAPVLLYNSQHASPYAVIAANVTRPPSGGLDSVVAVLTIAHDQRASGRWSGSSWAAGSTRRITIGYDAIEDSTGVVDYNLEVSNWYGGARTSTTVTGQLAIVNRKTSAFGAGWWIAGLEQLNPATMVWIGGDGSVRKYLPAGTNRWAAASVDHPDTLEWNAGVSRYIRYVSGGTQVRFNSVGQHAETVNRLSDTTRFTYVSGRLARITLPTGTATAHYYDFAYDVNGKLSSVSSPGAVARRTTTVWINTWRVDSISDPDNGKVKFGYSGTGNRIISRIDRRGTVTSYEYNGGAGRLSQVRIDPSDLNITSTFTPAETRALGTIATVTALDPGNVFTLLDGPRTDVVDTTHFFIDRFGAPSRIGNALGQSTIFRRGNISFPALVTRVSQPNGFVTEAVYNTRGNDSLHIAINPYAKNPAQNDTTRYVYGSSGILSDFVHRIVPPQKDSTAMSYFANGNREWQQDARGIGSRAYFRYYDTGPCAGLLRAVQPPLVTADSVAYDAQCNLSDSWTAMKFQTQYVRDALGRNSIIYMPTDSAQTAELRQQQRYTYTLMGRDSIVEIIGAAMNGALQQTQRVVRSYDAEGNPRSLTRSSIPDAAGIASLTTSWSYDRAGRAIEEVAPDGQIDSTFYDPAGNVRRLRTRRFTEFRTLVAEDTLAQIRMSYDALNRLTTRITPAVRYAQRYEGIPRIENPFSVSCDPALDPHKRTYPSYSNDVNCSYRAAGDTATFAYDGVGNMINANNADARISRTYYANGLIETDTLKTRTVDGTDFTQHIYGLQYTYDRNGRRTELRHPSQLSAGTTGVTTWSYHPSVGFLERVTDLQSNVFLHRYDYAGQLTSVEMPGGVTETYDYDLDGRRKADLVQAGWGQLRNASLRYDGRGKLTHVYNTAGTADTLIAKYSGLGHLVNHSLLAYAHGDQADVVSVSQESFTYDALDNQITMSGSESSRAWAGGFLGWNVSQSISSNATYNFGLGGRQIAISSSGRDTLTYDAAGNNVWKSPYIGGYGSERASFYAADGRIAAADYRTLSSSGWLTNFEEYRYDALGRRVWVRARKGCGGQNQIPRCKQGTIRRVVWDGAQELYEIQMPGGDSDTNWLENDTQQVEIPAKFDNESSSVWYDLNVYFGRVAYTPGLAVDQPLSVIRFGYRSVMENDSVRTPLVWAPFSIRPLWSAKGQADIGTFADGQTNKCTVFEGVTRCIWRDWLAEVYAWKRNQARRNAWHGSVLEDKRDAAGTLYRRNRYYDPANGRFTQEDPIGLAGGLNLYGFGAGDPVNYSDPFGLKVCYRGGRRDVQQLRSATESATGTRITLDDENCISEFEATGAKGYEKLQGILGDLVNSSTEIGVGFVEPLGGADDKVTARNAWFYRGASPAVEIGRNAAAFARYPTRSIFGLVCSPYPTARGSLPSLVAHELLGHAGYWIGTGQPSGEAHARRVQNLYHAAAGQPLRCVP